MRTFTYRHYLYSTGRDKAVQDKIGEGRAVVEYSTVQGIILLYATLHDAALPDAMRRYATLILPRYIHPSMHRYIHTYINISINLNLNLNININITLHYTALIVSHSLALHCIPLPLHYIDIPLYYNHYISISQLRTHIQYLSIPVVFPSWDDPYWLILFLRCLCGTALYALSLQFSKVIDILRSVCCCQGEWKMDLCSLIRSMARNCSKSTLILLCLREDGRPILQDSIRKDVLIWMDHVNTTARKARLSMKFYCKPLSGWTWWTMLRRSEPLVRRSNAAQWF